MIGTRMPLAPANRVSVVRTGQCKALATATFAGVVRGQTLTQFPDALDIRPDRHVLNLGSVEVADRALRDGAARLRPSHARVVANDFGYQYFRRSEIIIEELL